MLMKIKIVFMALMIILLQLINKISLKNILKQYASSIDQNKHRAYFDTNSQTTYEFIFEGLDYLKQYGDVYGIRSIKKSR